MAQERILRLPSEQPKIETEARLQAQKELDASGMDIQVEELLPRVELEIPPLPKIVRFKMFFPRLLDKVLGEPREGLDTPYDYAGSVASSYQGPLLPSDDYVKVFEQIEEHGIA